MAAQITGDIPARADAILEDIGKTTGKRPSISEVSELAGVDRASVDRFLKGKQTIGKNLVAVSAAIGVHPMELAAEDDYARRLVQATEPDAPDVLPLDTLPWNWRAEAIKLREARREERKAAAPASADAPAAVQPPKRGRGRPLKNPQPPEAAQATAEAALPRATPAPAAPAAPRFDAAKFRAAIHGVEVGGLLEPLLAPGVRAYPAGDLLGPFSSGSLLVLGPFTGRRSKNELVAFVSSAGVYAVGRLVSGQIETGETNSDGTPETVSFNAVRNPQTGVLTMAESTDRLYLVLAIIPA
jgi:hypothetical protein